MLTLETSHAPKADTAKTDIAALSIVLFGHMQVFIGGQPLSHLRSRKALALLALLALRQGHTLEREWLAGTLWPDADPEQAAASLRPVLSELRRALGSQGEHLQSPSRHTLALDFAGVDVDVTAFDKAITNQKPSALEQAVALYQGPLLEGSAEEWAGQERNAREQDCLRALGTLGEAALAADDTNTAAKLFRRAIDLAPGWEAARRGLMASLDKAGDSNAALRVYRELIDLLRSDPKAVPDEKTSALFAQIRADAKQRASKSAVDRSAAAPVPSVSGYLPHPVTDLIGRDDERLEVTARLKRSRLVTLTGPGGIGKTRLALAVAADAVPDYADGVWLVAFDLLSDGWRFARQIAIVLGLPEEADRSCLIVIADHLRGKRVLLVLDNCEHLLEDATRVAGHLIRECAGIRILATSREALGITGETAWAVPPLSVPDPAHLPTGHATLRQVLMGYEGIQLFVERAQAAQKTFTLTGGNALAVGQVCARLEGIPLAIELAAARIKTMTVEQIAARLDDRLSLLTGGNRSGQPRQQTLRATLDWSYNLLGEPERLLLARLSVFAGGWTLEAAEQVCAGDGISAGQVLDLLASLVEKSLTRFEESDNGGRYRLLETVRQYAAERLHLSGAAAQIKTRHRDWALSFAQAATLKLHHADQEEWLGRLDEEHDNLRTALVWAADDLESASVGLHLAATLGYFWRVRGHFTEGRGHLRRALEQREAQADTAERAKALNVLAMLATLQGDFGETRAMYEQSLRISRNLGDRKGIASSLDGLGNAVYWLRDYTVAWAAYEESLGISRETGAKQSMAGTLHNMGVMAYAEGDFERARLMHEESLEIFREQNDQFKIAAALHSLGTLACSQRNYTSARTLFEEGMLIARDLSATQLIAVMLEDFGEVDFSEGEYASAHAFYGESLSLYRELEDRRGIAISLQNLAKVAILQGDAAQAKSLYLESLAILIDLDYQEGAAKGLKGLAGVMLEQGQIAVHLFGAAEALREKIGLLLPSNEWDDYELHLAQGRTALGEATFDAAWEEGHTLGWKQVVAEALGETHGKRLQSVEP